MQLIYLSNIIKLVTIMFITSKAIVLNGITYNVINFINDNDIKKHNV